MWQLSIYVKNNIYKFSFRICNKFEFCDNDYEALSVRKCFQNTFNTYDCGFGYYNIMYNGSCSIK